MLKLLTITLSRSSTLLSAGGDGSEGGAGGGDGGSASLLPEVLERVLPLLARPQLAELHSEVGDIICRILSLLHATAPGLAAALERSTLTLFEGEAPSPFPWRSRGLSCIWHTFLLRVWF